MKKIITYGTFDLLHQGHIKLLSRAKALGDYLIVGVTSDSFDRNRGKLNVRNNVLERVEAVKATGLADKIIIEDYLGQKIDDIQKYDIDTFAIGDDWKGKFDYLKEFCNVIYLPRTQGVSSTMLRLESTNTVNVGIVGCGRVAQRFPIEASLVDGVKVAAVYDINSQQAADLASKNGNITICENFPALLDASDAVYIATPHLSHYTYIKEALALKKHVLCETPMVLDDNQALELFNLANRNNVVLMEANKTAYCPAFNHLIVMIKSGIIGEVVDIEASLSKLLSDKTLREFDATQAGGALFEVGSYPFLPIVKLLGCQYDDLSFYSRWENGVDIYTKAVLRYTKAVCSVKMGIGVKTEGDLVISGTKGYAYITAPWWKTDYFEFRYENQNDNKKYFYKWDGYGIRYEIQDFIRCIFNQRLYSSRLLPKESICMSKMMHQFASRINVSTI